MKGAFRVAPTVNTILCKAIEPKRNGCRKIRAEKQEGIKNHHPSSGKDRALGWSSLTLTPERGLLLGF